MSVQLAQPVLPEVPKTSQAMRAAIVAAPGRLEIVEAPRPSPSAGELLIAVERCGVCASNLARWEGKPWFSYPSEPGEMGHEGIGRVVAVGAGVPAQRIGECVAFLSNHAYAEFDVAKAAEAVPIPGEIPDSAVLGEPVACAWNIFQRSQIEEGDTVAIIGAGFLGALLVQLAIGAGAEVVALSRRPYAREIAAAFGANTTLDLRDESEVLRKVGELTGGVLCDVVIEATGKQEPLDLAAKLTRERGRLVIAGYHQDGPRQVNMQLWNWRGLDVINAHERDPAIYIEGMRNGIAAIRNGILNVAPLITHRMPLEQLDQAFEMTASRPHGFLKAVVLP